MRNILPLLLTLGCPLTSKTDQPEVGFGGGCEEHLFSICWPEKSFLESDPVQVNLEIWHGGEPDMCDAYFTGPVTFDLSPLKAAWKEAYGDTAGTIILNISGADESVEYSFE